MDAVARIADAVLYEGYVLWPYRRGALKNQRRWTFGGVYPEAWAAAHPDDRCVMQTQCLIATDPSALDVRVRFLHVVRRQVTDAGRPVDELVVDGERLVSWEEAVERESARARSTIPAGREVEGPIVRTWQALSGVVEVDVAPRW